MDKSVKSMIQNQAIMITLLTGSMSASVLATAQAGWPLWGMLVAEFGVSPIFTLGVGMPVITWNTRRIYR